MSAKTRDLGLTAYDELFQTDESRTELEKDKVERIDRRLIDPFPNHPFKVRMDSAMNEMVESVKQYGVLVPAIVRQKENGRYEMVAGHRRDKASELAGISTVPCIIRDLSDEEATIIMVDSNLQRENILPSEKALAYKMKLEAMKRQGERRDLTSTPVAGKLRGKESAEILGDMIGESKDQVRRYIRLTELSPQILDFVDNAVLKEKDVPQIAFRPAVELSYLTEEEQKSLLETIESEEATPSLEQAIKMKKFSQAGKLNEDVILSIMTEEKPNQREKVSFHAERLRKYIPQSIPLNKAEDYVVQALEHYQRFREKQKSRER